MNAAFELEGALAILVAPEPRSRVYPAPLRRDAR